MTPKPVATSDPQPIDPRAIGNLKHGLTGARLYFQTQEDANAYEELKTKLLKELAPETEIMRDLALQIVTDRYRLISAAEMESKIHDYHASDHRDLPEHMAQADAWLKNSDQFARIELYSSRIQRRWEKNFALYRQLQAERKAALEAAIEEAAQLADLAESKAGAPSGSAAEALAPTEPFTSRNFGFSSDQVAALLARYRRLKEARAFAAPPQKPLRRAA